ncbi:hypothetical protein C7C46_21890 [Streptomyces tateyamensis]|uniref:Uncharacterized protein n=1 Tax=Streptomyces tateyamensis TaxID=565073 RepID=A0A2V4N9I2_9ACTN|nr:hypothetical protein [Streptomyces tateyamensis]PYC76632.1 hypothetical protein C7C46_21890 [Streptomyces tateyamensis]
MTDDYRQREEWRAAFAQQVITDCLGQWLRSANEAAVAAVGSEHAAESARLARRAKDQLTRWRDRGDLGGDTAARIADAVVQQMESDEKDVRPAEEPDDSFPSFDSGYRAAVTCRWLRDQGYDVPSYPEEPGL